MRRGEQNLTGDKIAKLSYKRICCFSLNKNSLCDSFLFVGIERQNKKDGKSGSKILTEQVEMDILYYNEVVFGIFRNCLVLASPKGLVK